jgi:DNA-binding NarL/FixJ family response regulator
MTGIDTYKEMSRMVPSTKILFLSACSDADVINSVVSNGTKGYVLKAEAGREISCQRYQRFFVEADLSVAR